MDIRSVNFVFSNTAFRDEGAHSEESQAPCRSLRGAWQVWVMPTVLIAIICCALGSDTLGQTSATNQTSANQMDLSRDEFKRSVAPMLRRYCADCHLDGADEGGLTLDSLLTFSEAAQEKKTWEKVLNQLRHDLMPPAAMDQPATEEQAALETWVKTTAFEINEDRPDPGHVIVRRLNRIEYQNTIKDLIDYQIDTKLLFPPDDSGHGFDNIAEVLSLSPLLMEKYINAATEIISAKVPMVSAVPAERWFEGSAFELIETIKRRQPNAVKNGDAEEPEYKAEVNPESNQKGRTDADAIVDEASQANETDKAEKSQHARVKKSMLCFYYGGGGKARLSFEIEKPGEYDLKFTIKAVEDYVDGVVDNNRCAVEVTCDGKPILNQEFARESWKSFPFVINQHWEAGNHRISIEVTPLTDAKQTRRLRLLFQGMVLTGPLDDRDLWVRPRRHAEFFPKPIPDENKRRRQYAKELLTVHAKRAFRRPPEPETIEQLVDLAESVWTIEGASFEKGIAQAMIAILSSPSFIFRETFPQPETFPKSFKERLEKKQPKRERFSASPDRLARLTDRSTSRESVKPISAPRGVLIDEYSLATRLSYFLWSTTPDADLMKLADEGQLRKNLDAVVSRMIKDKRFESFYKNFMGQWLLTRDIEGVNINAVAVIVNGSAGRVAADMRTTIDRLKEKAKLSESEQATLDAARDRLRQLYKKAKQFELNAKLRRAMRRETEMLLEYIVDNDSDLIQLIDCDYTFLNARLAQHYGITGITGDQMRKVQLSPADHRGGVLTHGSVLAVTSNPDRTSPVKRGLFVLDRLLGLPPGAPPPDIPGLEQSVGEDHSTRTLRQSLAKHRANSRCSSCHDRLDPLGLALENFDALGRYRASDADAPIDASGELISGESFDNIDDLKKILAKSHKDKFYRCVTEKLMTYALGRSIEYYDLQVIDNIVNRLGLTGGKPSVLIEGVIKSPAFQMTRVETNTKHP